MCTLHMCSAWACILEGALLKREQISRLLCLTFYVGIDLTASVVVHHQDASSAEKNYLEP